MIIFFFWPLMILSIILSLIGVWMKKSRLLFVAAIFILPMSLYLAATPRFMIWGLIFPCFYIGSAYFVRIGKTRHAILINLPVYLLIGWIGVTVLSQ